MPRIIRSRDGDIIITGETNVEDLSLPKVDPNTLDNAEVGDLRLFVDDNGVLYSKDENGAVTRLGLAQILTPEAVDPTEGADAGSTTVGLQASSFQNAYNFTHVSSDWEVYDASNTLVFSSIDDTSNLTSITATGLSLLTPYKWRVRYKDSSGEYSQWATLVNFTTLDISVDQAVFVYPTDGETNVGFVTPFETEAFSVTGDTDTHLATQWQVAEAAETDFFPTVFDSGDSGDLLSTTISDSNFNTGSNYITRVRHKGSTYGYGQWSATHAFTTADVFDVLPMVVMGALTSLYAYQQKGDTFTALSNPPAMPAYISSIDISSDNVYMAIGCQYDPSEVLKIYKRDIDTFTDVTSLSPDPQTFGTNPAVRWVSLSGNGDYLIFSVNAGLGISPIQVYKRSGDSFSKLTGSVLNDYTGGSPQSVAFAKDSSYAVIAHNASPYLIVWNRSGDTFSNATLSEAATNYEVQQIGISLDSNYFAVYQGTEVSGNYLSVYKRSGLTYDFVKLPLPDVQPPSTTNGAQVGIAFSAYGIYMAVSVNGQNSMYKRTGDQYNKLTSVTFPNSDTNATAYFSPDDQYIIWDSSNIFKKSVGDTFVSVGPLPSQPANAIIAYSRPVFSGTPLISKPTLIYPTDAATGVDFSTLFSTDYFSTSNGYDQHVSTDWQISTGSSFSVLTKDIQDDTTNLESYSFDYADFTGNTQYYFRARHTGASIGDSDWSDTVSFTSANFYNTTAQSFTTDSVARLQTVYDTVNEKVVHVYTNNTQSQHTYAVAGAVQSDGSITYDTPVVVNAVADTVRGACFDPVEGKIIVSMGTSGVAVGDASGTLTFGTPVSISGGPYFNMSTTYDTTANKVVIALRAAPNCSAIVGTVSGNSISFGTPSNFTTSLSSGVVAQYDPNADKTVISYHDTGTSTTKALAATVSGTSIGFSGVTNIETSTYNVSSVIGYDSTSNVVIVAYAKSISVTKIVALSTSGSVTAGAPIQLGTSVVPNYVAITHDPVANKLVIFYYEDTASERRVVTATVSGTTISLGTPKLFKASSSGDIGSSYMPTYGSFVTAYESGTESIVGSIVNGEYEKLFIN